MRRTIRHTLQTTALSFAALGLWVSSTAQAEQFVRQGPYEIHYNAFNSSFLTPEVAQQYELIRSQYRALVNVTVLKVDADGNKTPVTALVSGQAANLLQQAQQLSFKKVQEGPAIYYLSSFRFTEAEQLKLDLSVQPDPNQAPYSIQFNQTFYTNE